MRVRLAVVGGQGLAQCEHGVEGVVLLVVYLVKVHGGDVARIVAADSVWMPMRVGFSHSFLLGCVVTLGSLGSCAWPGWQFLVSTPWLASAGQAAAWLRFCVSAASLARYFLPTLGWPCGKGSTCPSLTSLWACFLVAGDHPNP